MRRRRPGRRDHLPGPAVTGRDLELRTSRLRLRAFEADDLDALEKIFADEVMMEWYPHPFSRAESQHWIEWNQRHYRERGHGLWALELRETRELIGDCGLIAQHIDGHDEVEVGWHVKRELWGQGLAPEAAREVVRYAFEDMRVTHVISLIRPENVNSRRVAEKLGMRVWKETIHGSTQWLHLVYRLDAHRSDATG